MQNEPLGDYIGNMFEVRGGYGYQRAYIPVLWMLPAAIGAMFFVIAILGDPVDLAARVIVWVVVVFTGVLALILSKAMYRVTICHDKALGAEIDEYLFVGRLAVSHRQLKDVSDVVLEAVRGFVEGSDPWGHNAFALTRDGKYVLGIRGVFAATQTDLFFLWVLSRGTRLAAGKYAFWSEKEYPAEFQLKRIAIIEDGKCKWGFVDHKGNTAIPVSFDYVEEFSDGYAVAVQGGRWGYISPDGTWRLGPAYDWCSSFHNGIGYVRLGPQNARSTVYQQIDQSGRVLSVQKSKPHVDGKPVVELGRSRRTYGPKFLRGEK